MEVQVAWTAVLVSWWGGQWSGKASVRDDIGTKTCRTRRMGLGEENHRAGASSWEGYSLRLRIEKRLQCMGNNGRGDVQRAGRGLVFICYTWEDRDCTAFLGISILNPPRTLFRV